MTDHLRARWEVASERSYRFDIAMVRDILEPRNPVLGSAAGSSGRCLVFTDARVAELHGAAIDEYFSARGIAATAVAVKCEEGGKDLTMLECVLDAIEDFAPLRRAEPVVAVGGGVLLDVVGLAAGVYRRGIPYIRVPTTLIGAVDVSVAAKTGINHFGRRNRLGLYHPPIATYVDLSFLRTQPRRDIASGFGEILKLAVIGSAELFGELTSSRGMVSTERMERIAVLAISEMIEQLRPNLWESELRRAVDFGHSFSPAVEMAGSPPLRHGEAVFLDVLLCSAIAVGRGLLSAADYRRIEAAGQSFGLPVRHPDFLDQDVLWRSLGDTVRHRDGHQHLPVPSSIGRCRFVEDLTRTELAEAIQFTAAA